MDLGVVAGVKATVSAVLEEVRRRDLPGVVGKDIGCNLSSPEIDHVSLAKGYGVDGERVREPGELGPALGRYLAAMSEGRPYVLDAAVARRFGGAESTWYDFFSVAKREARRS